MSILLKLLLIFAIGSGIILLSLFNNPVRNLQQKSYKASIAPFSIVLSDSNNEKYFKISPFDDYFYSDSEEKHLLDNPNFKEITNPLKELNTILSGLFLHRNDLSWQIAENGTKITYQIKDMQNGTVQIRRKLDNFPAQIEAVGQAIVLCEECLVSDENMNFLYVKKDQLTAEVFSRAQLLNLTPLIITKQLPKGIAKLLILTPSGERKLEIEVIPDQEIYYLSDWNILILKTPVKGEKSISVSQNIRFY